MGITNFKIPDGTNSICIVCFPATGFGTGSSKFRVRRYYFLKSSIFTHFYHDFHSEHVTDWLPIILEEQIKYLNSLFPPLFSFSLNKQGKEEMAINTHSTALLLFQN